MNPSSLLVNAVLHGVLGSGRKRSRGVTRYLTGDRGVWTQPSMLMTAAGLAWGVFESLEQSGSPGHQPSHATASAQPAGDVSLPPLPAFAAPDPAADSGGQARSAASSGPVADYGGQARPTAPETDAIDPQALRMIRLAISAANADGSMNDRERAAVVQQAQAAGLADIAERELAQPRPLREIVGDVGNPQDAATLYVLAFSILRADESVRPTERVFLAQLASLLRLERSTVEALEQKAGARIDALGDQGQPGG